MNQVPFGKVPTWVGHENCPLSGAVEFALIAILAARRAVRRKRFFYKGVEVVLEPGHVCVSQRDLAEKLKVDRQRIRTGLKNLQKLQILNPPTNPPANPSSGPVPQVFFFNVDMQLDVFGELYEPTSKPKRKPRDQPKSNPTVTQQQPTSIDVKMDRCLEGGDAGARVDETEPQAQPPPDQIADQGQKQDAVSPEKIPVPEVLPDTWRSIATDEFQGVDDPSRRFVRFSNHYAGERMTVEKWSGRWRNWLLDDFEPVQGDVSTPAANGQADSAAPGGNGHDPPVRRDKWDEFRETLFCRYRKQVLDDPGDLQLASNGDLFFDDTRDLRSRARSIADGTSEPPFGIEGGPKWDWREILNQCPEIGAYIDRQAIQSPTERREESC